MPTYLPPEQLLNYYDVRRVTEIASDTGTAINEGTIATNAAVLAAIYDAESAFDSALQVGMRYDRAALEALVTAADDVSATDAQKKRAAPIKAIVAHLTFGTLMGRRGYSAAQMQQLAPQYEVALQRLEDIGNGRRVLDVDDVKSAGVPSRARIGANVTSLYAGNRLFGCFPNGLYGGPYG